MIRKANTVSTLGMSILVNLSYDAQIEPAPLLKAEFDRGSSTRAP
jgi:hypothetical protein